MVTQGHSAADVKDLASVTARMAEAAKARATSVEKERSSGMYNVCCFESLQVTFPFHVY